MTDAPAPPELGAGYSSAKRGILLYLKRAPDSGLLEVARELGISRVAALKHLAALESDRLVERSYRRSGVGRPKARFRLSQDAVRLFPEAYTQMSLYALSFIEERLGHDAVVTLLQQRAREVYDQHRNRVPDSPLPEKVGALAQIRAEGGYMAEVGPRHGKTVEMLEHNCPILAIAGQYPEACEVERKLFEQLLKAKVEVSHRVVAGDGVCRFVVRPREARS